jgi:hypothetical protein
MDLLLAFLAAYAASRASFDFLASSLSSYEHRITNMHVVYLVF